MQKTLIILSILLFSSYTNLKKLDHDKCATMVTVKYVDWDIETPLDIKCDDFETAFPETQIKITRDPIQINHILNTLKHLKVAGKDYYQHVDTRMKLEIKYCNDSIETICMDRFIINRNNKLLINSNSLKSLLAKIK